MIPATTDSPTQTIAELCSAPAVGDSFLPLRANLAFLCHSLLTFLYAAILAHPHANDRRAALCASRRSGQDQTMAIIAPQTFPGAYLLPWFLPAPRLVNFVARMVWSTLSSPPASAPYNVCVNPADVISPNTSLKVNFFPLIS